jgi:hypothetical protein
MLLYIIKQYPKRGLVDEDTRVYRFPKVDLINKHAKHFMTTRSLTIPNCSCTTEDNHTKYSMTARSLMLMKPNLCALEENYSKKENYNVPMMTMKETTTIIQPSVNKMELA